jgi:hypothetical protein
MDSRVADHHWTSRGIEEEDQDRPSHAQTERRHARNFSRQSGRGKLSVQGDAIGRIHSTLEPARNRDRMWQGQTKPSATDRLGFKP